MSTPLVPLRRLRRHASACAVALVALGAGTAATSATSAATLPPGAPQRGDVQDVRASLRAPGVRGLPRPARAERTARRDLVRRLGREARLDVDPLTDTVRVLQRLDGALTGPAAASPQTVARRYARDHAAALGLDGDDVDGLVAAPAVRTPSGISIVRFRQAAAGIPAFDNELRIAVDRGNRVVTVAGAPRHDLAVGDTTPDVSARAALAAVQAQVGDHQAISVTGGPAGDRRVTTFATGDVARLVLFGARGVHLAWHVTLHDASGGVWDAVVDATTGQVLRVADLVKHDAASVPVFPDFPKTGGEVTADFTQYLAGGVAATSLSGPYVHAFADVDDDDVAAPAEEVDPNAVPAFAPQAGVNCGPALCSWEGGNPATTLANKAHGTANAFWLANRFHQHLAAAPIGFGAARGAFEGGDRLELNTFDGATKAGGLPDADHADNANMATPPDGQSPRMQMYLWSQFTGGSLIRDADGAEDASIVLHEYTHGLSSRLVTWSDGTEALDGRQSGAMGEAWSDFYAMDFLVRQGIVADGGTQGEIGVGRYVGINPKAIRTQALDCKVRQAGDPLPPVNCRSSHRVGGYTYGDVGKILGAPEVHADGEIWAQTLWDLRDALGSTLTEQLVTDAMSLSPPEPTFLDMRNALLAADTADAAGTHHATIWAVFANRGMGYYAASTDTMDSAPMESFAAPPDPSTAKGSVSGTVTDGETGRPLSGVTVGLSGHDTDPAFGEYLATTTAPNGAYNIGSVPEGGYPLLALHGAPGWDIGEVGPISVHGGSTTTTNVALRFNYAALAAGAGIAATDGNADLYATYGCGTAMALDQSRGTGWSADVDGAPSVTIELPRTIDVTRIGLDPTPVCGDPVAAGAAQVKVQSSADGSTFDAGFVHDWSAGRDTVAPPSPLRGARYVKFTLLTNQGASSYVDVTDLAVYGNVVPQAALSVLQNVTAGQTVAFDASGSRDPDGDAITAFEWDFDGNGTPDQTTATPTVTHAYDTAGTYLPRVRVRDARDGTGTAGAGVIVSAAPPDPPPPDDGHDSNPRVTPPTAPSLTLPRSGRRSLVFTAACKEPCRVSATLRVTTGMRRRARLTSRTLARLGTRTVAGTRRVRITVPRKVRTRLRRAHRTKLRAVLVVTATVTGGDTVVRRRTVTLRV